MAEAHQAVAFSFSITHEGWDINYDREVLNLVWESGTRSWKKRLGRLRVNFFLILFWHIRFYFFMKENLNFWSEKTDFNQQKTAFNVFQSISLFYLINPIYWIFLFCKKIIQN